MAVNQKLNKTSDIKGKPKELKKKITAVKSNKIPGKYFDILFENAGVYVMLLDLKRNILNTNPAFQKLLKYTGIELSGLTLKKITHPEDYRREEKLLKDLAIGKKTKCTIEKRYITKSRK